MREQLGLEDVRIHDLRHTYASLLVNKGVNLYEVQQLLGHSSAQMTQRYADLAPIHCIGAPKLWHKLSTRG